jgi:hypothetical protein
MRGNKEKAESGALRPLTQRDLDAWMHELAGSLAAEPDTAGEEPVPALRPRPIEAAELVRRLAPFTGRN